VLVLATLAGAVVAGCGGDEDDASEPPTSGQTNPQTEATETTEPNESGEGDVEAARLALEGVIARDIQDPAYHVTGFRDDPAVSADLIAEIDQLTEEAKAQGATGLDFDPFVCAQQIPANVTYNLVGSAGTRMTFNGVFEFGPKREKVTYVVIRDVDDSWKLDATECVDAALPKGE
jgi:hypothetical protein